MSKDIKMSDKHVRQFREGRREGVEADRRVKVSGSNYKPNVSAGGATPAPAPTVSPSSSDCSRCLCPNRKPAAPEHWPRGRFTCTSCPSPPFVRSAAWFSDLPKNVSRPCSVAGRESVFKTWFTAADTTPAKHTLRQRAACTSGV